jgi:hypothetical protein
MRHILTVTFSALTLAGCANGYDKSAGIDDCKSLARPDQQSGWRFITPGVWSTGPVNPGEFRFGGGSHKHYPVNMAGCVHDEKNRGDPPQIHNPQKIGMALAPISGRL